MIPSSASTTAHVGFAEKFVVIPAIGCVLFHFVQNKLSKLEELLILAQELSTGGGRMCLGTSLIECLIRFVGVRSVH
jgi:hypothetical protein